MVAANVAELFPNMKTSEAFLFRVTRDADIELREDEAGDLMRTLERELQRRRDRFAVRLEISAAMPEKMVKLLATGIGLTDEDVERVEGFVDIPDLMQLYGLERPRLKEKPIAAIVPAPLQKKENIFDVIKKQDILLHHPYTSFSTVSDFIAQAAEDPERSGDKDMSLSDGKRFADRQFADAGEPSGQTGDGSGRAKGPF